ncbi:MAG TPA: DNA polymerase III subunit beta [Pseudonocardiaceae bacterium]|nr:DNA polymerase III subunit beta [Pseudonocardiaceae bacterium]
MEFELERDAFAEAVAWTARGLPSRPVVPVTAGVVLEVADGALIVSGFDFEVLNRIEVPVTDKSAGRVLVSGRLLAEIARALPPKDVRVAVEGNRLAVRCGSARFNLPLLHIEDYPAVPELPATSGTVRGDVFATAVAQVAAAASRDETLPMLTGVRMEIGSEALTFAATDRYRLSERRIPWTPNDPVSPTSVSMLEPASSSSVSMLEPASSSSVSVVVPAKTLADVAKSLGSASEVVLSLGNAEDAGFLGFSAGGRQTLTRLLDGEFVKFASLWPTEVTTTVEVEVGEFIAALKRVSLVAQRFAPVRLAFADGIAQLSAEAEDESSAEEELEVGVTGEPLTIGFNAGYLLDGLTALTTPRATLSFTTPARPTVITPVIGLGADEPDNNGDGSYRYLVMSMRLRG